METEFFIERRLEGYLEAQGPFPIVLRFGRPREGVADWACSMEAPGLGGDSKPRDIFGVDALQAFTLALDLARMQVKKFLDRGGRISLPGEAGPLSLEQVIR